MPIYEQYRKFGFTFGDRREVPIGEESAIQVKSKRHGKGTLIAWEDTTSASFRGINGQQLVFYTTSIELHRFKTVKTSDKRGGRDIFWARE